MKSGVSGAAQRCPAASGRRKPELTASCYLGLLSGRAVSAQSQHQVRSAEGSSMTAPLHHQQILMRRPHSRAQARTAGAWRKVTLLALALLAAVLLMTSQLAHAAVAIS